MMNRILNPLSMAALAMPFLLALQPAMASDPAPVADKAKVTVSPAPSSDDEMSKALTNKISKGSGDIVIRTSDLPVGGSAPATKESKSKPAVKALAKPAEKESHAHHWSYFDGPEGPENWGNLSKDNLACLKGKSQSPININIDRAVKAQLNPIEFIYRPSPLSIIDNGHTVMVNYGEGSNLMVDGRQYRLIQFHFHKPSEEAINGERTDMVAHLVHQHHDGSLAVVAVLMSTIKPASSRKFWWGDDSIKENAFINTLWNNVPLVKGKTETPGVMIDINQMLPADKNYFTYMGSLTTPPCSENVLWLVLKNPIYVSEDQVKNFDRMYPMNARPLQPRGDRLVKETKDR
ncbi:carbonic anhydrase family protein [Polynucleobacter sp. JS-Mosq-20-D10]|uniref:carbonic anhydrase n=1 Tax=Polynucleobacter sp. JS-Mosq-20-D10 TaxID=2576922 RepID=UPI001BFDA0B2|nr:carbonic anhydrase family protein [Polynucleobacter sp. JS-Mosq-20-D10]QWE00905.1 carbonic anhydrase family protein [Polynucleobacter sp. JS-Mosq-20-D10]